MKTVEHIENILKEKTLLAQNDLDFFEKLLISIQSDNHNLDEEWQEDKANSVRKEIHALLELNKFPKQNRDLEDKEIYLKYRGLISCMSEDLLQNAVEFLSVRDRIVLCPTNKQWYKMIQSTLIYEFAVPFMRLNQKLGTIYLATHRSFELNRKICLPTIEEQRIHLKKALEDGKELASLGCLNHFFFNELLVRSDIEINGTTPSNIETNAIIENLVPPDDIWSRQIREFLIKVILVLFALHSERRNDPLSSQLFLIFRLIIFATSLTIVPIKTKRKTKVLPPHQPETQLQEYLQNFSRVNNYSIESKALISHSIVNPRRDNFPTYAANSSLAKFSFF